MANLRMLKPFAAAILVLGVAAGSPAWAHNDNYSSGIYLDLFFPFFDSHSHGNGHGHSQRQIVPPRYYGNRQHNNGGRRYNNDNRRYNKPRRERRESRSWER